VALGVLVGDGVGGPVGVGKTLGVILEEEPVLREEVGDCVTVLLPELVVVGVPGPVCVPVGVPLPVGVPVGVDVGETLALLLMEAVLLGLAPGDKVLVGEVVMVEVGLVLIVELEVAVEEGVGVAVEELDIEVLGVTLELMLVLPL